MTAGLVENHHVSLVGPGQLEVCRETLAPLAPDFVRIRFEYCGLCGTDVAHVDGRRPPSYPVSLGHEWVATVEHTGVNVGFFQPGDVVVSDLNFRCGHCPPCRAERSHLCEQGQRGWFSNRGFGQRADIHASYLHRCSGPIGPQLALAEPLSCARHALRSVAPAHDETVLVLGAGGIGLCLAFLLGTAEPCGEFDLTDRNEARLSTLAPLIAPLGRADPSPTGAYDVVIDATGTESGLRAALERLAPAGRLCLISHLPPDTPTTFLLDSLIAKDASLRVTHRNGEPENLAAAVAAIERHWDHGWDRLLDVHPLAGLPGLIAERSTSPAVKTVIAAPASGSAQPNEPLLQFGP